MSTVPTQIRIDSSLKKEASELFSKLGLDMSSAVNIFLRQCVLRGGIPFEVSMPKYKPEVIEAMEEAEKISMDPNAKTYDSFSQILKELD
ncbi:MAG: type II toxin-antitoxin system RelB/DinJ family antitoxin [Erysipelotrichaceae bacterium]